MKLLESKQKKYTFQYPISVYCISPFSDPRILKTSAQIYGKSPTRYTQYLDKIVSPPQNHPQTKNQNLNSHIYQRPAPSMLYYDFTKNFQRKNSQKSAKTYYHSQCISPVANGRKDGRQTINNTHSFYPDHFVTSLSTQRRDEEEIKESKGKKGRKYVAPQRRCSSSRKERAGSIGNATLFQPFFGKAGMTYDAKEIENQNSFSNENKTFKRAQTSQGIKNRPIHHDYFSLVQSPVSFSRNDSKQKFKESSTPSPKNQSQTRRIQQNSLKSLHQKSLNPNPPHINSRESLENFSLIVEKIPIQSKEGSRSQSPAKQSPTTSSKVDQGSAILTKLAKQLVSRIDKAKKAKNPFLANPSIFNNIIRTSFPQRPTVRQRLNPQWNQKNNPKISHVQVKNSPVSKLNKPKIKLSRQTKPIKINSFLTIKPAPFQTEEKNFNSNQLTTEDRKPKPFIKIRRPSTAQGTKQSYFCQTEYKKNNYNSNTQRKSSPPPHTILNFKINTRAKKTPEEKVQKPSEAVIKIPKIHPSKEIVEDSPFLFYEIFPEHSALSPPTKRSKYKDEKNMSHRNSSTNSLL